MVEEDRADSPDFDIICKEPFVDSLGRMSHVTTSLELGPHEEPWQAPSMIKVEVGH